MNTSGPVFATKSAPPPPSPPDEEMAEERMDQQQPGNHPQTSSTPADPFADPDFLMEVNDPFNDHPPSPVAPPLSSSAKEGNSAPSSGPNVPLENGKSSSSARGKENRARGEKQKSEGRQPLNTTPPPNVDELLASLEAQVGHPQPAEEVIKAKSPEKEKKKRKPRSTRQQKLQTKSSTNKTNAGSQRTVGVKLSAFKVPAGKTNQSGMESAESSSSASARDSSSQSSTRSSSTPSAPQPAATPSSSHAASKNRTWRNPSLVATSSNSSSTTNTNSSGYNRKPNDNDICYDISSFKFIPDDSARVDIVLQTIQGERRERSKGTARSMITFHNLPTIHSSDVTDIPCEEAPGARADWDMENFMTVSGLITAPEEESHPISIGRNQFPFFSFPATPGLEKGGKSQASTLLLISSMRRYAPCLPKISRTRKPTTEQDGGDSSRRSFSNRVLLNSRISSMISDVISLDGLSRDRILIPFRKMLRR